MMTATIQQHRALPNIVHFDLIPKLGVGIKPCAGKPNDNIRKKRFETYTLYLIRHGEAAHNILEKAAKQEALENCIEEGLDPDSPETLERMDAARQAVLHDATLFDAGLSDQGKAEAKAACQHLQEIIKHNHLPPPEHVLASPLTRTLETTNLIFPESKDVHVREELRERQTGKPPDTRSTSASLSSRKSFQRFSMEQLRILSMSRFDDTLEELTEADIEEDDDDFNDPALVRQNLNSPPFSSGRETEETKAMVRDRTKKLLGLLAEAKQSSVAVVTHKGYLRELERGPFNDTSAKEFKNCEIRVYQVRLHDDGSLEHAHRIV